LDLMWPGGIGGQETVWDSSTSAYLLSEPTHRYSGSIGSPEIVAHDETPNENRQLGREPGLAFTIRAGGDHASARVIITGGPEGAQPQSRPGFSSRSKSWKSLQRITTRSCWRVFFRLKHRMKP
jgi:hypothetical protein